MGDLVGVDFASGPDWTGIEVWQRESDGQWRRVPSVDWNAMTPEDKAQLMARMFGAEARGDG